MLPRQNLCRAGGIHYCASSVCFSDLFALEDNSGHAGDMFTCRLLRIEKCGSHAVYYYY